MRQYFQMTKLDPAGHAPTQEQINEGLDFAIQSYPGPRSYNVGYWQPHLSDPDLIPEIWKYFESVLNLQIDFDSMPMANKQVWTMIYPESHAVESSPHFLAGEDILTRPDIVQQIYNTGYIFESQRMRNGFLRGAYARAYMSIHALVDYMNEQYGFLPTMINKVFLKPYEFNARFGEYFNNIPVLPVNMSTFWSKPAVVKHNPVKRGYNKTANGAIIQAYPCVLSYDNEDIKTMNPAHYWDDENRTIGTALTLEERFWTYRDAPTDMKLYEKELTFNMEDELFENVDYDLLVDNS